MAATKKAVKPASRTKPKVSAPKASRSKYVLIRSVAAGVHFGVLLSEKFTAAGKVVVLTNTRRAWYWKGAASLSQMAVDGVKNPSECKFSVAISENEIVGVIETIPLSKAAIENLYQVPIWRM